MLILTRKMSDVIWIGDDIRIEIVQIGSNRVQLGIEAPGKVNIVRGELLTGPIPVSLQPSKGSERGA